MEKKMEKRVKVERVPLITDEWIREAIRTHYVMEYTYADERVDAAERALTIIRREFPEIHSANAVVAAMLGYTSQNRVTDRVSEWKKKKGKK